MIEVPSSHRLLRQIAGALFWAGFFILAPAEILICGAIVWIPLLVWRERLRAAKYGFLPGAIIRASVVVLAIIVAACLPTKAIDRKVGPLSSVPSYLSHQEFEKLTRGLVVTYIRPADDLPESDSMILLIAQSRIGLYECTKSGKVRRVAEK